MLVHLSKIKSPTKFFFDSLTLSKHYADHACQNQTIPVKPTSNTKSLNATILNTAIKKIPKNLLNKVESKWTDELDEKLKKVTLESQYYSWKELTAKYFPGFTSVQVYNRSKKIFKAKGKWTDKELDLLKQAVVKFGTQWTKVARFVETRSSDQCLEKWYFTKFPGNEASVWTKEESEVLFRSVINCAGFRVVDGLPDTSNVDWQAVSESLDKKGPVHCKYHFTYNPSIINRVREHFKLPLFHKGSWSSEETSQLIALLQKYSTNWPLISRMIETRSVTQCENRWRVLKKALRQAEIGKPKLS